MPPSTSSNSKTRSKQRGMGSADSPIMIEEARDHRGRPLDPPSSNTTKTSKITETSSALFNQMNQSVKSLAQKAKSMNTAANKNKNTNKNKSSTNHANFSTVSAKADSDGTGSSASSTPPPPQRSSSNESVEYRKYTVKELIVSLDETASSLPPALERRVRDFKMAQQKRREKQGDARPWGILGLYQHLSDIRADLEWAEDAAWRRQNKEPYLSWSDFEETRKGGNHNRPWFTYTVILICSIMMLVTMGVNDWVFEPLAINPLLGPSSEALLETGARSTDLIVNEGQWYRLLSPILLHAGFVHFLLNMAAMYYIGGAVEQSHGHASAAVLFVVPAVGGNILSAICLPQYISVGASGGIFGLIGGCVADISINWNLLFLKSMNDKTERWRHMMVLFWLAFDIFLNCMIGLTPFVDNFTHLGGFLYGLLCGLSTIEKLAVNFFGLSQGASKMDNIKNTLFRFMGLIVSVIAIMITTGLLADSDGRTSPCHGCRYISCVPFPPGDDKWWYCDDCDGVQADLFVSISGSGLYTDIDLTCPDGTIKDIGIAQDELYERSDVRRALPGYCREHCDSVFINN
ncbi:unnamed protein product [Cylindrotheca closterium]|uniref:rhomboid protease n=1 Tax=Cylindrotheca closterium TaxID=2856 RepID=A0AAD2CLU5_9STRA|nr:unnamed protein product [Cylindrotheca closterium]